ncbi:hypothetical protein K438DRAFT_435021 [Mycena galopus ATCC 62051]|nr:hypothetical protein K438DRAFT_435021 [Mycena galopus ATCC 62051]
MPQLSEYSGHIAGVLNSRNFDILLDSQNRFLLSINTHFSEGAAVDGLQDPEDQAWGTLNALAQKVLRSANCAVHQESIERNAVTLESLPRSSVQNSLFPPSNISEDVPDALPPVPAQREYVWRNIDRGHQSLARVAGRITLDLDLKLSPVLRLNSTNAKSPHRCPGYIREEITLAATIFDSAVVSHDTPSPLEICSVCHEVVGTHDAFNITIDVSHRTRFATHSEMSGVQGLEPQRLCWKAEGIQMCILLECSTRRRRTTC